MDPVPKGHRGARNRGETRPAEARTQPPRTQRKAFEMLKLQGMSVEGAAAWAGVSAVAPKLQAHRVYGATKALLGG